MEEKKINLASPHMSEEGYEMTYIQEAFDTNWIAPLGKNVEEFEREVVLRTGAKAAAALSSGTAAIHMALIAAGVGEGDIVFCPTFTFSASANPIIYQKAIPVFIDSDDKTWNMSPEALEEALVHYTAAGRKPKAVLLVHLYGICADIDQIKALCDRYDTILIEDAAESLGTLYRGKHTGTFGKYGVFSFNGNKIITTSGGGMLVSDDEEAINKVKFWSTQARDPARYYQHSELGFNYRMSNVLAGIGRGQLKVLDLRIEQKKYIYEYYKEAFSEKVDVSMMPINDWNKPNYWLSCMRLGSGVKPIDIILTLEQEKIEARHIWKPLHLQPFFKECDYYGNAVAENIFHTGVCLPSDTKMKDEDLQRITELITRVWK
ncbi:MAG: beta-eliminating lyase family protein [Herbinix sp.]|jgi:dTDP-4-amino-4,6-dideoxygalactose transaminase|nr:beta-eliminating lyase family protein [Herbinix sp.]